jgi:hypothetical protein
MTTTDLDAEVATYLDLTERIEQLVEQRDAVKVRLLEHGTGQHPTSSGLVVSITPPNRRFNADRAWAMLNEDQRALCVSPDPKKIKAQLPEVLVDQCMDEGTGAPRVTIK